MNIVVFIKQVPDTNDVKWTANNNIDRTQMESIMNPVDKQAVQAALLLKNSYNAHITVITMGPCKSVEVLKEAVAMRADDAAILCDSKFAGSDTCATSKVLAAAIQNKYPDTDLILFGQSAIDGETAQTGPSTAARLNLPVVSNVNEITDIQNDSVTVNTENETEKSVYKINLPAVLCINNYVYQPEVPRISGYIHAHDYNYKMYNIYELNLPENSAGIKGSPTFVSKVYRTNEKRECKIIDITKEENYCFDVISEIKEVTEN
ncbi:MAG: electron transfer flavoprotein subunit beta/FixA family protein [Candidatus Gastranaerophilales bacterium]|nr:electron transfer flavoprotein subunit beta/FixA family protein [Candidatus Gastranaerophilales bacterium]